MCGLVAVIAKKPFGFYQADIDVFKELLYVDALRGWDATGVISVEKNTTFHIDKEASTAEQFLISFDGSKTDKRILQDGVALIGHNRKATIGKGGDATAHPFVVKDHFAMVHNGTLYNHEKLAKTTVDSEALAMVIEDAVNDDDNPLEALSQQMWDVYGAYATIWYNQVTNRVQVLRNNQRPLAFIETDSCYYIASEGIMLAWILRRNIIKYEKIEVFEEDHLYTFDLERHNVPMNKEALEKKSYPTSATTSAMSGVGTHGSTNGKTIPISKRELKKLRTNLMNRDIEFFVLDHVEASSNDGDHYLIIGECAELEDVNHCVQANLSVAEHGIYAIEYVDHFIFKGKVTSVTMDKATSIVVIKIGDFKALPASITPKVDTKNETSTTLH